MKKASKLSSYYIGEQYNEISSIGNRFGEYKEFKKKYSDLILKHESSEVIWTSFLSKYFNRVLEDLSEALNKKSKKNIKRKKRLKDISTRLKIESLQLPDLQNIRKELDDIEFEVNENKRESKWNFIKWLGNHIISFILGLIGGIVLILIFG